MCVCVYVCPCVSYICICIYIYIHVYYDAGVFDQQKHMCVYYDYLTHSLGIQKGRAGTGSKLWVWPLSATKGCQANGASTDWLLFFFARVQFPRTTDDGIYIYIYKWQSFLWNSTAWYNFVPAGPGLFDIDIRVIYIYIYIYEDGQRNSQSNL